MVPTPPVTEGDGDGDRSATTLYRGGSIYAPGTPRASAMLVDAPAGRILWIGSDEAAAGLGRPDDVVELAGALVTPAFVDAHVHTTATGLALLGLDLHATSSAAELLGAVADAAGRLGPDDVVQGTGWDDSRWDDSGWDNSGRDDSRWDDSGAKDLVPSGVELLRASGGRSVHLVRVDGHAALATPDLLAAVGLPPTSSLVRGAHAERLAELVLSTLDAGRRRTAGRAARSAAARAGIASLHEMGGPGLGGVADLTALLALAADEPGPEVVAYWAGDVATALELGAQPGGDVFVDGSLGSYTAALSGPYADGTPAPSPRLSEQEVLAGFLSAHAHGRQTAFHAIGDAALAVVLAAAGRAAEQVGLARFVAARHRVEHALLVDAPARVEFARLGLLASVQPAFVGRWGAPGGMYEQRLGDRTRDVLPLHALATAGVPLAFGSDAPVTPLDPWAAVREASSPRRGTQAIAVRAAFTAATRGGRRAARQDGAGVLRPGAPATFAVWEFAGDLVVRTPDARVAAWSTDPRAATPGLPELEGVPAPTCMRTVIDGRRVFDADRLERTGKR